MNVIQSYLTSIIKGDFSLLEIRIFVKIVECANKVIRGEKLTSFLGKAVTWDGITANMAIDVHDIISDKSQAYGRVFDAAKSLSAKTIEYFDNGLGAWVSNQRPAGRKGTEYFAHIIDNVRYKKGEGIIEFTVPCWILNYILDFVHRNYNLYDFEIAMSLPSSHAVRLYWLFCNASKPLTYSVKMLRELLGCVDRYPSTKDFIKRCIENPCRIMKDYKVNGFTYVVNKKNPKAKNSVIKSITFYPVKRQETKKTELAARLPLSSWAPKELTDYLLYNCHFTDEELNANKSTLHDFSRLNNWRDLLFTIVERQRKKEMGKGYIIAAMKSEISEQALKSQFRDI